LKRKKKLYEGRTKNIYTLDDPDQLIQEFKDDVSAFNEAKPLVIKGKGIIDKNVSVYLFEYLEGFHIPTHFLKDIGDREMLVKRLDMIPIEVVMCNITADSLSKRYGLEQGKELNFPIMEFYIKDNEQQKQMINQTHIVAFELATMDEVRMIERMTSKINAILKSFFLRRNLKLVDFKLEYGRYKNKIVVGDEISPDSCHLWDVATGKRFDKIGFRSDLGNAESAYEEIKKRIF